MALLLLLLWSLLEQSYFFTLITLGGPRTNPKAGGAFNGRPGGIAGQFAKSSSARVLLLSLGGGGANVGGGSLRLRAFVAEEEEGGAVAGAGGNGEAAIVERGSRGAQGMGLPFGGG